MLCHIYSLLKSEFVFFSLPINEVSHPVMVYSSLLRMQGLPSIYRMCYAGTTVQNNFAIFHPPCPPLGSEY